MRKGDEGLLVEKIIKRADADNLPADHELRVAARRLSEALSEKEFNIPRVVGRWAKARRLWSEYTGYPLV